MNIAANRKRQVHNQRAELPSACDVGVRLVEQTRAAFFIDAFVIGSLPCRVSSVCSRVLYATVLPGSAGCASLARGLHHTPLVINISSSPPCSSILSVLCAGIVCKSGLNEVLCCCYQTLVVAMQAKTFWIRDKHDVSYPESPGCKSRKADSLSLFCTVLIVGHVHFHIPTSSLFIIVILLFGENLHEVFRSV